jgi:hypothetical protein
VNSCWGYGGSGALILSRAGAQGRIFDCGRVLLGRCDKLVYRMLREGSCFGETNFAKGSISSQFSVHANTNAVVVEVPR